MKIGDLGIVASPFSRTWISNQRSMVLEIVRTAYLLHDAGRTESPPSAFLRFRDRPTSRVIALPACVYGDSPKVGLKWIASNPSNPTAGLQRASSVIVLNDYETGYPIAVMEGSLISAARTAASAALAAEAVAAHWPALRSGVVGFVGCGPIARAVMDYLVGVGFVPRKVMLADAVDERARIFRSSLSAPADVADVLTVMQTSDVVVLATSATAPHISEPSALAHARLLLNLSLRDLAPGLLVDCQNYVDDKDHALREGTSLQLAQSLQPDEALAIGTIGAMLRGEATFASTGPIVYSPFGLGMLDVAVASSLFDAAMTAGQVSVFPNFLPVHSEGERL